MEKYYRIQEYVKDKLGIDINNDQLQSFKKFKEMLIEWNNKINLTSIKDENKIILKHFMDSISCLESNLFEENFKIIDIGTGAGFPGIPLKIIRPDLNITLLDSLNKRVSFLKEIIRELELKNITAIHGRAEDMAKDPEYREIYDISVSRAVASLNILSEYCLPFVKVGGYFISMKGPACEDEKKAASSSINILGGKIINTLNIDYLNTDINHNLIIINKIKKCPSKYPRRTGIPTKKPL